MPTGARPSLIGDLTALSARLDRLCTDQNPEGLSDILRAAFKERELYNLYISFLEVDEKRAKALLEIFDKVCPGGERVLFHKVLLKILVQHRHLRLRNMT
jgi:hypothetical protein